jgi:hypothetical protein
MVVSTRRPSLKGETVTQHVIFDTPHDYRLPDLWVDTIDQKRLAPKIADHLKRHWSDWSGYDVHLKQTGDRGALMNADGTFGVFTVTTLPYELNLQEDWDTGVEHPNEQVWQPSDDTDDDITDALGSGFFAFDGIGLVSALGDPNDELLPTTFLVLGHHPDREQMTGAALGYMTAVHHFPDITRYPHDDTDTAPPADPAPEISRLWAVFLRHPHPDFPCGCEHEGWRIEEVPQDTEGAVAITTMRHPAYREGAVL